MGYTAGLREEGRAGASSTSSPLKLHVAAGEGHVGVHILLLTEPRPGRRKMGVETRTYVWVLTLDHGAAAPAGGRFFTSHAWNGGGGRRR
jgi:hypothetical protein